MNKKKTFKIFGLTCAGVFMLASPGYCQWPTLDISQVTNMINGVKSQLESTSSTVQSTMSIGNMQQALGDSVGSLSKFSDDAEKAKEKAEKLEKQKKRAEKLAELKKQFDEKAETAKELKEKGEAVADKGKSAYEKGTDFYEQGTAAYEQGKDALNEARNTAAGNETQAKDGLDEATATDQDIAIEEQSSAIDASDGDSLTADDMIEAVALDDEAIADMVSDAEFSEGSWDIESEAESMSFEPEDSEVGSETPAKSVKDVLEENSAIPTRRAFRPDAKTVIQNVISAAKEQIEQASTVGNTESNTGVSGIISGVINENKRENAAVAREVSSGTVSSDSVPATDSASPDTTSDESLPAAVPTPVRRAFTTSSADFLYQSSRPMAFAQTSGSGFKTGTNADGKFIFSDTIANECGINYDDDIDEEKIEACIKIWVLGMNDANAETAADWKEKYNKALRDHSAADLAAAQQAKNYAASFDSKVADDLDNKSKALTNEREEISLGGEVGKTNQETLIKMLDLMGGLMMTEAFSAISSMDKGYYSEE